MIKESDLVAGVHELATKYLNPGAASEVNCSDRMKRNILEMIHKDLIMSEQATLLRHLEKAQNEILLIMTMGSFPRFLKTPLYEDYHMNNVKDTQTSKPEKTR